MINGTMLYANVEVLEKAFGICKVNEEKCMDTKELSAWLEEKHVLKAKKVAK